MAICLPGIASRVNRAPTSATRPAPFVTTMNWMTTRIRKTTRPMTSEPPMTMWPNASMTLAGVAVAEHEPGARHVEGQPEDRADEHAATGKTANSSGLRTCIATSRTSSAIAMLPAMSTSSSAAGSGTTIMITTSTTMTGTASRAMRLGAIDDLLVRGARGSAGTSRPSVASLPSRQPIARA